jgi:hypothetical protein
MPKATSWTTFVMPPSATRSELRLEHAKRAFELMQQHGAQEFWGAVAVSYVESAFAANDTPGPLAALDQAKQWLEARAAHIDDLELRRGFLEHISEHRRLRELMNRGT